MYKQEWNLRCIIPYFMNFSLSGCPKKSSVPPESKIMPLE